MKLGVCYYPEHWPESRWQEDAERMRDMGLSIVRIGEFAWSRLEPSRAVFNVDWLQRAMDTLADAGLSLVLGTPTATPPKWLIDEHPSILATDADGHTRGFGSRRHYCFSSPVYRQECSRIVGMIAERFGNHDALVAWQTDNEYGCHNTIASYSEAARTAFQQWCQSQYETIEVLNERWGNVFWSMEYSAFSAIELPAGTVTEANPAHQLAFWRFCSDQVRSFNKLQCDLIRQHSPGRDIVHNYMGNFTEFDHYLLSDDLDVATWDNYPLGFLDRDDYPADERLKWMRTGHPDSSAFHHDLYRGVGKGRWWIMEQQPGPVNWAPHNPAPLDGMVRLWGWEGLAHGAEVVSWFRWRALPSAQEQLHAGLLRPDGMDDSAADEVRQVHQELAGLPEALTTGNNIVGTADVAIVFDYASDQLLRLLNNGGQAHDPFRHVQQLYSACRQCGVNIDIVSASTDLADYRVVILPGNMLDNPVLTRHLKNLVATQNLTVVLFPGSGSRTDDASIHPLLGPGAFRDLIDVTVIRSESLPPDYHLAAKAPDTSYWQVHHWREKLASSLTPKAQFDDGWGFHYQNGTVHYVNAIPVPEDLTRFIRARLHEAGVEKPEPMNERWDSAAEGLRVRHCGDHTFVFNYGPSTIALDELGVSRRSLLFGDVQLKAGAVALWDRTATAPEVMSGE